MSTRPQGGRGLTFDLLVVHGANHNAARGGEHGPYGDRKRHDFFARHLLGLEPPDWNKLESGNPRAALP